MIDDNIEHSNLTEVLSFFSLETIPLWDLNLEEGF